MIVSNSVPDLSPSRRPHSPTRDCITAVIGGIDVNKTVTVPNRLMARIESAAARGSVRRRSADAMAEELAPSVTPRVT